MKINGECHCGNIRFEAEVNPDQVRVCHCTACQNLTGSAYRVNVPVTKGTFKLSGGEPKKYVKTTSESETRRVLAFCPECGTPLYSAAEHDPQVLAVRVGTVRQRAKLRPKVQQWCRSKLEWAMDLRNVSQIDKQVTN